MDASSAVTILISVSGVIALVNLIQSKVDLGKWAALAAFGIGISLNLAAWAAHAAYVGVDWFTVVAAGALTGLAASGLHDVTK